MAQSTGLQFTVKVGALAENTFAVASFKLDEGLNSPFSLKLEVASHQLDIDFGAVLDQPCELLVWYNGELQRRVCGVVCPRGQRLSSYPLQPGGQTGPVATGSAPELAHLSGTEAR